MSPLAWALAAVVGAFFIINFIVICPDKLPWNKRREKREHGGVRGSEDPGDQKKRHPTK